MRLTSYLAVSSFSTLIGRDSPASTSQPLLPSDIGSVIFPDNYPDPIHLPANFAHITLLQGNKLGWTWCYKTEQAPRQIFAYAPVAICTALDLPIENCQNIALSVYIPTAYKGPADQDLLGTLYHGSIPSTHVDSLAQQINTPTSRFYIGQTDVIAQEWALQINTTFDINQF